MVEDDLMARFAVNRHVVRGAPSEPEKLGILERSPIRGESVRGSSPEDVRQISSLRRTPFCEVFSRD